MNAMSTVFYPQAHDFSDLEGRIESHLMEGLTLYKYTHEVQFNGGEKKGMRPQVYALLDFLHDAGGIADIELVKLRCWRKSPRSLKSTIFELNAVLVSAGAPAIVRVEGGEDGVLVFDGIRFKSLNIKVQGFEPHLFSFSSIIRIAA